MRKEQFNLNVAVGFEFLAAKDEARRAGGVPEDGHDEVACRRTFGGGLTCRQGAVSGGVCTLRLKSPVSTTKVPGLYDQSPRSLEPFDARLLG